ncbi:hypothetical protein ACYPKM_05465 [Pseudomonas aeruginosa]
MISQADRDNLSEIPALMVKTREKVAKVKGRFDDPLDKVILFDLEVSSELLAADATRILEGKADNLTPRDIPYLVAMADSVARKALDYQQAI